MWSKNKYFLVQIMILVLCSQTIGKTDNFMVNLHVSVCVGAACGIINQAKEEEG